MPPPRGRPPSTLSPLPSFSCADTGTHAPAPHDRPRRRPPFRHSRAQTRESTPPPRTTAHDAVPPFVILVRPHGNPRPRRGRPPTTPSPLPSSSCADTGIHSPAADDRTRVGDGFRPCASLARSNRLRAGEVNRGGRNQDMGDQRRIPGDASAVGGPDGNREVARGRARRESRDAGARPEAGRPTDPDR